MECPVCNAKSGFRARCRREIAGGRIYTCGGCGCYFLHPYRIVEYVDSVWTARRAAKWEEDAARSKNAARRISDWFCSAKGHPLTTVLEIGCGSGFMGIGFKEAGVRYTGIDVDTYSVKLAKSKGIDAHVLPVEELSNSSVGATTFDLVLSSNTLEHVSNPIMAFNGMRHVCNGIIVVIVPNPEGFLQRIKANRLMLSIINLLKKSDRDIAYSIDGVWHNYAYSKSTLRYLCAESGFIVGSLRSVGINDPIYGFVQPNRWMLYRMASRVTGILDLESQLLLIGE